MLKKKMDNITSLKSIDYGYLIINHSHSKVQKNRQPSQVSNKITASAST
jgi:hypothetical protein